MDTFRTRESVGSRLHDRPTKNTAYTSMLLKVLDVVSQRTHTYDRPTENKDIFTQGNSMPNISIGAALQFRFTGVSRS